MRTLRQEARDQVIVTLEFTLLELDAIANLYSWQEVIFPDDDIDAIESSREKVNIALVLWDGA